MSQLKVNSIVPVGGLPSGSNGGIIQTVSATKSDTASFTASTSSPSSLESIFPITITPSTNSSKILVKFVMTVGSSHSTAVTGALHRKIGGGSETALGLGDADGSRDRITQGILMSSAHNISTLTVEFLDSPATTSACKYYLKLDQMTGSSTNYFIGRSSVDSNVSSYARGFCQAIAMEITS